MRAPDRGRAAEAVSATSRGQVFPGKWMTTTLEVLRQQKTLRMEMVNPQLLLQLFLGQHFPQELEDLLEKYRILETDFLKHKEDKVISHEDQYNKLQEKHKLELEDLRRAGHEALAIIVEEFKALLQSTVQQRKETIEKQYASVIEKQAQKCEELLIAQHQRLLDMLDKEHKVLEEKTEESLLQQSQKYKNMLEKCMESERESNKEALAASAKDLKIEKEELEAAIVTAVKAERENMKKLHVEEKELWQAERNKDQERIAQAIADAVEEQRQSSQSIVKAAILEEQEKSEKAIEKAVKQTREELMEYIKEQKRYLHWHWMRGLSYRLTCQQLTAVGKLEDLISESAFVFSQRPR
uniref:coiled-coil domain-containing protein 91 isoform X11 n=1 Tax=Podarcis muralis TaxID=64176 RepID=UPI0010A09241|nr:coiled-coil domain-containing protein 91 isoform X11 [Podarcis muralis]